MKYLNLVVVVLLSCSNVFAQEEEGNLWYRAIKEAGSKAEDHIVKMDCTKAKCMPNIDFNIGGKIDKKTLQSLFVEAESAGLYDEWDDKKFVTAEDFIFSDNKEEFSLDNNGVKANWTAAVAIAVYVTYKNVVKASKKKGLYNETIPSFGDTQFDLSGPGYGGMSLE